MQPKFTLNMRRVCTRVSTLFFLGALLFAGRMNGQTYMNGNVGTGTTTTGGGNATAPAGTTWHELQAAGGVANTTLGLSHALTATANFTVADDFTIPAGASWTLSSLRIYLIDQTNPGPGSPYNDVRVRIWNGTPGAGGTVIWGDLTTNVFSGTGYNLNRGVFNHVTGTPTPNLPIFYIDANVTATLAPGTYWVEWQVPASFNNFTITSQVVGVRALPSYNARQSNAGAWAAAVDAGSPANPAGIELPFRITYSTGPCTGTPNPGNTITSAASSCPATPVTLSLQNATLGSGVTYQWQSASAIGGPYTNIAGATNPSLTTTISATTYFQAQVTCSGNTGTSTPVEVALTPASGCYCIPPTTDCTDNDMITRVVFGTINNASTCSPNGYGDYTTTVTPTNVIAGGPNPIRVEAPTNWNDQVAVWIDYNKNGQFEASEFTNLGLKASGATFVEGNINVPASATLGQTRMRVRLRFSTALGGGDACLAYTFGETEDYTVNIVPCVPISITTQPASTSIACAGNATFTVATTGSIPAYSWEYRPNASTAWQMVTNGGIYSGATTNTLTLTNVPGTMSGYQYRALVSGACSAVDFSNAATLTVTPIVATVNPTSATICTGSIQQLTLTNASSPATVTFNSTGAVPIPDANAAGMSSPITVSGIPAGAVVTNVSVTLNISHTWVGDLDVNIVAPNNISMNLVGGLDGGTGSNGTDNFVNTVISSTSTTQLSGAPAPRTGTFRADRINGYGPSGFPQVGNVDWPALLTTLNGTWRLVAADFGALDVGTVNSWSISITYGAPATGVWTANPATPNTMWLDAAATVPYVAGSQATTIYVNPTVNTNYSVVYSTATPCTSNPTVIPVTVINPIGAVTSPVNTAACIGSDATFTVSAAGGPMTQQWQVSTDGGTTWTNIAGATGTTLTLSDVALSMNNNRYRAVLTAAPCAGSVNSDAAILTVNELPVVTLSSTDVSLIPGQTTTLNASSNPAAAANGWSWTYNHNAIPGTGNSQVVGVDQLGTYQATVTDVNGCVSTSNELVIDAEANDKLWIYPNPTTGQFQVRMFYNSGVAERRIITIYNQLGQVMESKHWNLVSGTAPYLQMDFDLSHLPRGIYVVKVAHQFTGKVKSGLVILE